MSRRWTPLTILPAVLAAAVGLVGCGTDEPAQPTKGRDLSAVYCPMEPAGTDASGKPRFEPADSAFDTAELVGERLDAARRKAGAHGCEIVVAFEDGKGIPVSIEIDPTRIYVYTERGVVTQIEGVGGGL